MRVGLSVELTLDQHQPVVSCQQVEPPGALAECSGLARRHHGLAPARLARQHVGQAERGEVVGRELLRRRALLVGVEQQHVQAAPRRLGRQADGRRRLADAALLVHDRDDAHSGTGGLGREGNHSE